MKFLFAPLFALTLVACSLPSITTQFQTFNIRYSSFLPGANNQADFNIPMLPKFDDQQAPASSIPVPSGASGVPLGELLLTLRVNNDGPIPLSIKMYVSKDQDPYQSAPLGNEAFEIPAKQTVTKSFSLDPNIVKEPQLYLGYKFSSAGSTAPLTISARDNIAVSYSIKATPKLF
jgi:hypothetical protein